MDNFNSSPVESSPVASSPVLFDIGTDMLHADCLYYYTEIERTFKKVMNSFCYGEIRTPILEHLEIFKGLIKKEGFNGPEGRPLTFKDSQLNDLTLRPNLTSGAIRSLSQHAILYPHGVYRVWSEGPVFISDCGITLNKYQGSMLQFQQFYNFEGKHDENDNFRMDAEIILISSRIFEELGVLNDLSLEINLLNEEKTDYFNKLCSTLENFGIKYKINRLLTGNSYYSNLMVFNWINYYSKLTSFGGRGHGITVRSGKPKTNWSGCEINVAPLLRLVEYVKIPPSEIDIYVASFGDPEVLSYSQCLILSIRKKFRNLRIEEDFRNKAIPKQVSGAFKNGFQKGPKYVLVITESEFKEKKVRVKSSSNGTEEIMDIESLVEILGKI